MCDKRVPYWPQNPNMLRLREGGREETVCWYPQTLVSSTSVMPGHRGRQYMEWGIMGYSPSLSETSKKTLRGVEGSGGGTSRVCKLSSAIWRHFGFILSSREVSSQPNSLLLRRIRQWNTLSPGCLGPQTQTRECFLSLACLVMHKNEDNTQHTVVETMCDCNWDTGL